MEKVVFQIAIVGYFPGLIVQFAFSTHEIVFPLSFVAPSLLIGIFSETLPLSIGLVAFVLASVLEFINRIHQFFLFLLKLLRRLPRGGSIWLVI